MGNAIQLMYSVNLTLDPNIAGIVATTKPGDSIASKNIGWSASKSRCEKFFFEILKE